MDLAYDKLFKLSLTAMTFNGTHPFKERNKKWLIKFIYLNVHTAVFFQLFLYNIIYIDLNNNDYIKACSSAVICVICIVITFQTSVLIIKREYIRNLINAMKKDYELTKTLPKDDQEIVLEFAKNGQRICKQWLYITSCCAGVYPLRNIYFIFQSWRNGNFEWVQIIDISFFFKFLDENKKYFWCYFITSLSYNYLAFLSAISYTGFVPLGPSFMMHACGQLELVRRRIEVLFDCDDVNIIKERLKCIVKQMQYIYSFVNQIQLAFTETYEVTLKMDAILLPATCYAIIETLNQGTLGLEFVSFFVGGIFISFTPCYYSELLQTKGEEVRQAMYSCGWEKLYDKSIRSTVRLFLLRSLRPLAIRTLFRTLCLDALADLFRQSYAIFNLIISTR